MKKIRASFFMLVKIVEEPVRIPRKLPVFYPQLSLVLIAAHMALVRNAAPRLPRVKGISFS